MDKVDMPTLLSLTPYSRLTGSVSLGQDTSRGLEAIARIAKQHKLDGVFGPLYSLFEVDDKYKVAVEVTAGNRCGPGPASTSKVK